MQIIDPGTTNKMLLKKTARLLPAALRRASLYCPFRAIKSKKKSKIF
jgi:hypothetical protein